MTSLTNFPDRPPMPGSFIWAAIPAGDAPTGSKYPLTFMQWVQIGPGVELVFGPEGYYTITATASGAPTLDVSIAAASPIRSRDGITADADGGYTLTEGVVNNVLLIVANGLFQPSNSYAIYAPNRIGPLVPWTGPIFALWTGT